MKIRYSFLLVLLALVSCRSRFENYREFEVDNNAQCQSFAVAKDAVKNPLGYVDHDDQLHVIKAPIDRMARITNLWFSPNGQKVIIESKGEGHQFISVYRIATLVDNCEQSRKLKALAILSPYPYHIWNIKWLDDGTIRFSAFSDFSQFDNKARRGAYDPDHEYKKAKHWDWNLKNDTFAKAQLDD